MSDNKYDLNVIYDDRDFHSQDMEIEDQEGEALLDQEEEQPVDSMEMLVCRGGQHLHRLPSLQIPAGGSGQQLHPGSCGVSPSGCRD